MKFTVCPFCGVVSEGLHDSQKACIQALQIEIEQTRHALAQFGHSAPKGSETPEGSPDETYRGN